MFHVANFVFFSLSFSVQIDSCACERSWKLKGSKRQNRNLKIKKTAIQWGQHCILIFYSHSLFHMRGSLASGVQQPGCGHEQHSPQKWNPPGCFHHWWGEWQRISLKKSLSTKNWKKTWIKSFNNSTHQYSGLWADTFFFLNDYAKTRAIWFDSFW